MRGGQRRERRKQGGHSLLADPDGISGRYIDGIMQAIVADRPAYISEYLNNCYNVDLLGGSRVSDDAIRLSWTVAVGASAIGTLESVMSWLSNFRHDLPQIDVPMLMVPGRPEQDPTVQVHGQALVWAHQEGPIRGHRRWSPRHHLDPC